MIQMYPLQTALCAILLLQMAYWAYFYLSFFRFKTTDLKPQLQAVSIVICAKNETSHLQQFLPLVLQQDYPLFEVVVVDDASSDNSLEVLFGMQEKYKHLRILSLDNAIGNHGKKRALSAGIKEVQYERLLLIDADCRPASPFWLQKMISRMSDEKQIILGYGSYIKENSVLNGMIRFDTQMIALQYFSFALKGLAYMGVGRNLAYHKSLFQSVGGFKSHEQVVSGDDDLFIMQAANLSNVAIQIDANAFTYSPAKNTWRAWIQQKARHVSTSYHYTIKIKCLLILAVILPYSFYGLLAVDLFSSGLCVVNLLLFSIRCVLMLFIAFFSSKMLNEQKIWYYSIIFEILLLCIYPVIHIYSKMGGARQWKN
jgi:glycosyltransferase involved in cell wall biosynthesis